MGNFIQEDIQSLHELLLHDGMLRSAEQVGRLVEIVGQIVELPLLRFLRRAQTSTPNPSDPNFSTYGSSFASFLLGQVASASRTAPTSVADNTVDISPYIQDDIKVNRKLTMNVGLRWDIMVPYLLSQNENVFLNPTAPNPAAGNIPGAATEYGNCQDCAGYDRVPIHWKNFGPRVGFVYSLDNKTVLQAGYYITYLGYGNAYGQGEGLGAPSSMSQLLAGSYQVNATGSNVPGYGIWSGGPNTPLANPSPTPFNTSLGVAQTIYYVNPEKAGGAPHYQAWSANVQRQLPWSMFVSFAFMGNRVTHLGGYSINPISQPATSVLQYGSLLTANVNLRCSEGRGLQSAVCELCDDSSVVALRCSKASRTSRGTPL